MQLSTRIVNGGQAFKFKGFNSHCEFSIKILRRQNNMSPKEQGILLSSIWLWANLGGIGQRARKGFGSPVIDPHNNISPFVGLNLPVKSQFSDFEEIREHLCKGLSIVWMIFEQWVKELGYTVTGHIATNPPPTNASYFILRSLRQIAVNANSYSNINRAFEAVHGSDLCKDLGWAGTRWPIPGFTPEQLKSPERMASPVYTRFHVINTPKIAPIITWCEQRVRIKTEVNQNGRWVENERNLIIPDKESCLRSYLQGGECKHGFKFAGLNCTTCITGATI